MSILRSNVALVQGLYYVVTGLWPLFSMRTFQMVTGPKTDLWLVKTVGMLVTVIGVVLGLAGMRRSKALEIPLLAIGSASALAGVDVVYTWRGRVSRIFLLDALAELALIMVWAFGLLKRSLPG